MSDRPDVSVVIVAHRAREHVLRCLSSLAEGQVSRLQKLVIDDASEDETDVAVRERFPDAQVIVKQRREGLVAGRNTALEHLHGRFVLMLDADTWVQAGAIDALRAVLEGEAKVGLVGPRLRYPDGELQLSCRRLPPFLLPLQRRGPLARLDPDPSSHRHHLMKDFDHRTRRPVVWVAGAAQMWRADLPERIGRYDPRISSYGGEDIDWCLRVWRAGLQVHYVPDADVVHHSQRVTLQKRLGRDSRRALRDYYYLQLKHRGLRRDDRLREAQA